MTSYSLRSSLSMFVLTWQFLTPPGAEGAARIQCCWHFSEASATAKPHTAMGCNMETGLIKQLVAELIQEVIHSTALHLHLQTLCRQILVPDVPQLPFQGTDSCLSKQSTMVAFSVTHNVVYFC